MDIALITLQVLLAAVVGVVVGYVQRSDHYARQRLADMQSAQQTAHEALREIQNLNNKAVEQIARLSELVSDLDLRTKTYMGAPSSQRLHQNPFQPTR